MTLRVLHPAYNHRRGISYLCHAICEAMPGAGLDVRLHVITSDPGARGPVTVDTVPSPLRAAAYKLARGQRRLVELASRRFVRATNSGDRCYVWPGTPEWVYAALKDKGATLIAERINCHRRMARRVLDAEYERLGLTPSHGITSEAVERETRQLAHADAVFAANPFVAESLREVGVPDERIWRSSYGWHAERVTPSDRAVRPAIEKGPGLNVLFVGRVCVRKGAHLLLRAWRDAGVEGRLVFAGAVDDEIRELCAADLSRDDVAMLPYTSDVASVYASGDVFAFPSLEEGGPMVTYEAAGAGLALVVSPMGAGAFVREPGDARVLDPHDHGAWVGAIRSLASDPARLSDRREAARARAPEFLWDRVGASRAQQIIRSFKPEAMAC